MAVIRCPYCKNYISSLLSKCPECGKVLVEETTKESKVIESQTIVQKKPEEQKVVAIVESNAETEKNEDEVKGNSAEEGAREGAETKAVEPSGEPEGNAETEAGERAKEGAGERAKEGAVAEAGEPSGEPEGNAKTGAKKGAEEKAEEPSEERLEEELETEVEMPQPKRKKRKISIRRVVTAIFFLLLIGGITFFIIIDKRRSAELEQRAFERLDGCTNLLYYEDYIMRFPEGQHIEEVKKLYAVAKAEQEEFYKQAAGGSREMLEKFIKEHPSSPYVRVCEKRIDSLDWDIAVAGNTIQSYQNYLEQHPQGIFAEVAVESKSRQAKLEVTNEERSMLSGSLDTFLAAMTSGDESRVDVLVASPMNFCGEEDATGDAVMRFYADNFHHDDVIGVHFSVKGGLDIKKKPSSTLTGAYDYTINAQLDAVLNRSAVDSVGVQTWNITANLTHDRKFKSIDMRKQ